MKRIGIVCGVILCSLLPAFVYAQQCVTTDRTCTEGDGYRFCSRVVMTSLAPTGCAVGMVSGSATMAYAMPYGSTFIFACIGVSGGTTGYCTFVCAGCTIRIDLIDGLPVELMDFDIE